MYDRFLHYQKIGDWTMAGIYAERYLKNFENDKIKKQS